MKIDGFIFKDQRTQGMWAVEIPALGIHTQGTSRKDALEMAKDAIETVIDSEGFEVTVTFVCKNQLLIASNNTKLLLAQIFKNKRIANKLTAQQVADKMGEKSVTGYLRYEQGKSLASMDKISEIMNAINPELDPILKIG